MTFLTRMISTYMHVLVSCLMLSETTELLTRKRMQPCWQEDKKILTTEKTHLPMTNTFM